jgi:acyl-CoA thioesterase FadM
MNYSISNYFAPMGNFRPTFTSKMVFLVFLLALRQIYQLVLGSVKRPVLENKHVVANFRLWPVDMDVWLHMNNAAYPRVAELASWQLIRHGNLVGKVLGRRWSFNVGEQTVVYKKSIRPFQRYQVLTTANIVDQKMVLYRHIFRQHPADTKPNQAPIEFATVEKTIIVKDQYGKTVPSDEMFAFNLFS